MCRGSSKRRYLQTLRPITTRSADQTSPIKFVGRSNRLHLRTAPVPKVDTDRFESSCIVFASVGRDGIRQATRKALSLNL
eukprot:1533638-Rhodomonas_salina.1